MPVYTVRVEWKNSTLKEKFDVLGPPDFPEKEERRLNSITQVKKFTIKLNKEKTKEYNAEREAQKQLTEKSLREKKKPAGPRVDARKVEEKVQEAAASSGNGTESIEEFFYKNLSMIDSSTREFRKAVIEHGTKNLGYTVTKVCGRYNALVKQYVDAGKLSKPARGVLKIEK